MNLVLICMVAYCTGWACTPSARLFVVRSEAQCYKIEREFSHGTGTARSASPEDFARRCGPEGRDCVDRRNDP